MNAKTNIVLLAIAVVLVGLWMLLENPFSKKKTATVEREALFAAVSEGDPARVVISQRGESVTLVKQGETWVLENLQNHPANQDMISDLLDKLRGFKGETRASTSKGMHAEYEVTEEAGTRVQISGADGKTLADCIIGLSQGLPRSLLSDPQIANNPNIDLAAMKGPTSYLRRADEDTVYVVRQNVGGTFSVESNRWMDRRAVQLEGNDAVKLEIVRGEEKLVMVRQEDDTPDNPSDDSWILEGETPLPLATNVVRGMVNAACTASVDSLVMPEEGLDTGLEKSPVVVTVHTKDGSTATVKLGHKQDAEDDNSKYYFAVEGVPYVYLISNYTGGQFTKETSEIYNLDLATYQVRSPTRMEIISGVGEEAARTVFAKSGDAWDAPWVIEAPEGLATDKEAVESITAKLVPSSTKADAFVLDGSEWTPGPGSRTFRFTPTSYTEDPPVEEALTVADPATAVEGRIRVRVEGRTPDLWIAREKIEDLLKPIASYAWPAEPETPPDDEPSFEGPPGEDTPGEDSPGEDSPGEDEAPPEDEGAPPPTDEPEPAGEE